MIDVIDTATTIRERVDTLDWNRLETQLDATGYAVTPVLLGPDECRRLAGLFDQDDQFRSTIEMARYRFGDGRYRYFNHPLPDTIEALRSSLYPHLVPVANRWAGQLSGAGRTFAPQHSALLEECHAAGQLRPTPLILRYREGDWNALHQDLYGDVFFPFQVVTVLSRSGLDFEGGEFVLLEQRPRAQSRAHVISPGQGALVIFPTAERPNRGAKGYHRVRLRHGVSTVTQGERTALGVIFHDAR